MTFTCFPIIFTWLLISLSAVAQGDDFDKIEILKNKYHFETSIIGKRFIGQSGMDDSSFVEILFEKRKLSYQRRSKFANYSVVSRYRIVYGDSNMFTIEFIKKGRVYVREYGYFIPPSKTQFYLVHPLGKETDADRLSRMKKFGFLCKQK